jgi:hypothetical protein
LTGAYSPGAYAGGLVATPGAAAVRLWKEGASEAVGAVAARRGGGAYGTYRGAPVAYCGAERVEVERHGTGWCDDDDDAEYGAKGSRDWTAVSDAERMRDAPGMARRRDGGP